MLSRNSRKAALLAALLLLLLTRPAQATTIDPLIWEQMVSDAEFVGIAECETAGGIVARYRVLESWKGMPAGTRFSLRVATNYWGPQFPVTFVGEKYLFTAYKSQAPTRMMSTTSGQPVPLWWRDIPAEYNIPLWQGRVSLPLAEGQMPLGALGSDHPDLNSFKKAAEELLALSTEAREVRLLQVLSKKYVFRGIDEQGESEENRAARARLISARPRIRQSTSAREIVSELLAAGREHPKALNYSLGAVLSQGGGAVTLQLLKAGSFKNTIWEDDYYREIVAEIEHRLGLTSAQQGAAEASEREQPPTAQQLARMRKVLAGGPESKGFGEAFTLLTRHDPAPVAEYLVKWTNPQKDWWDADYGYVIGSFFAARCGKDREANLQKLFGARDPFVRVAGAVYLAFENPAAAKTKLEELSRLPGDPGVWAALNLARRGHRAAVPRALEVFATSGPRGHMSGVHHRNLQLRLLILLSNSAAAGNLPQPSPPEEPGYDAGDDAWKKYQESFHQYYAEWWRLNESKVRLSDPWLPLLEQQKVD